MAKCVLSILLENKSSTYICKFTTMAVSFCARKLLLPRSHLNTISRKVGYIVLLPEIGEDVTEKNPLLKDDKLPEFNNITIEKCKASVARQSLEFEDCIKTIEKKLQKNECSDIVKDVLNPIEDMYIPLHITWGIAKILYYGNESLMPSKHYFDMHQRVQQATCFKLNNREIYNACIKALEDKELNLTVEQKALISKYVIEGKLNGLALPINGREKAIYDFSRKKIQYITEEYQDKYKVGKKVLKLKITDLDVAAALPEKLLKATAADPTNPHIGPWRITMDSHIYNVFMEYCPDRVLRWKAWEVYVTVGSLHRERYIQLSTPLENLRYRSCEEAKALGYKSYSDMSMETKMAGSLENVYNTFDILREAAYPCQKREIDELTKFANERGLEGKIRLWDVEYWNKKYCSYKHNIDMEALRNYFPLPKVLDGLFKLMETLFDIKIVEAKTVDVWHKDVRFFDIFDLKKQSMEPIANFYLDPYTRDHAKTHLIDDASVVAPIKRRSSLSGHSPLVALIFNFSPPVEDKPSLLSFEDVRSVFETFGFALSYFLTESKNAETASFIETDFVQVPRFFMENWLYEIPILKQISGHYATNEPLPTEISEILKQLRTHFAGYKICNNLYLSHLDLELYSSDEFWVPIMNRLWRRYLIVPNEKKNCHVCSFADIFIGYSKASYFSLLWSKMIAADMYGAFQEISCNDKEQQKQIGNRYRETVLALSGIYPANEIFRRFRGRDYSPKALLKNLGMENNTTV